MCLPETLPFEAVHPNCLKLKSKCQLLQFAWNPWTIINNNSAWTSMQAWLLTVVWIDERDVLLKWQTELFTEISIILKDSPAKIKKVFKKLNYFPDLISFLVLLGSQYQSIYFSHFNYLRICNIKYFELYRGRNKTLQTIHFFWKD